MVRMRSLCGRGAVNYVVTSLMISASYLIRYIHPAGCACNGAHAQLSSAPPKSACAKQDIINAEEKNRTRYRTEGQLLTS